jgi:hypothetical protein
MKKLWPFGGKSDRGGNAAAATGFFQPNAGTAKKPLGIPEPSKIFGRVEKGTGSMIKKTKATFSSFQSKGKSLNPFARKSKRQAKKPSLWRRLLSSQPADQKANNPSTVSDFLSMERPSF